MTLRAQAPAFSKMINSNIYTDGADVETGLSTKTKVVCWTCPLKDGILPVLTKRRGAQSIWAHLVDEPRPTFA